MNEDYEKRKSSPIINDTKQQRNIILFDKLEI